MITDIIYVVIILVPVSVIMWLLLQGLLLSDFIFLLPMSMVVFTTVIIILAVVRKDKQAIYNHYKQLDDLRITQRNKELGFVIDYKEPPNLPNNVVTFMPRPITEDELPSTGHWE